MGEPVSVPSDDEIEAAARAMHDDELRLRYVEVSYPECAEQYRDAARVALTAAAPHDPLRAEAERLRGALKRITELHPQYSHQLRGEPAKCAQIAAAALAATNDDREDDDGS